VLGWDIQLGDAAILCRVPFEFMILPLVLEPDVCRENLIFEILEREERRKKEKFIKVMMLREAKFSSFQ
jgi:hypothetical protein